MAQVMVCWLTTPSRYQNQGLEYGGMVGLCVESVGTTEPQLTLESEVYTNVVMPHPGNALLLHDDNCCDVMMGMCRKWAVLPWRSPRDWWNYASSEIPNLRHNSLRTPRAFPCQLIGCSRVNVSPFFCIT